MSASSLAKRLSRGVLVIGLAGIALQLVLLHQGLRPVHAQLDDALVLQVRTLDAALQAVPPAERQALAQLLSGPEIELRRLPAAELLPNFEPGPPPWGGSEGAPGGPWSVRLAALQARLPAGSQLLPPPPDAEGRPALRVLWPLGGEPAAERWMLRLAMSPPTPSLGYALASWLLLCGLLAFGALLVGVRLITRPLERLAAQIAAQGATLAPLPQDGRASQELQALVHAFNQLVQMREQAQRQRGQMLAGLSHDLRTPLTRLRLRIETQLEGPVAEALEADLRALQHMADQFLHFVQGELAPLPGAPRPLRALVQEVLEPFPQVLLDDQLPEAAAQLRVAETALRRLLLNLVDNALAHGAPPVRVSLRVEDGHCCLRVSDGGPGLQPAQFEQALQPFVRGDAAGHSDGHCGLGLAIAAQMARALHAELDVEAGPPFAVRCRLPLP